MVSAKFHQSPSIDRTSASENAFAKRIELGPLFCDMDDNTIALIVSSPKVCPNLQKFVPVATFFDMWSD